MSAGQDRIEENIGGLIEAARGAAFERPEQATVWALLACAEALDGIRQALVRGEAVATITSYMVTP